MSSWQVSNLFLLPAALSLVSNLIAPRWTLALIYFVYYGALGIFLPYWARYLAHQGFLSAESGMIFATVGLAKLIAPTLWARWADRSQRRSFILRLASVLTLVFFSLIARLDHFYGMLLAMSCFSFSWNAVMPQVEVITLQRTQNDSQAYARIRLWGSVGFIVMVGSGGVVIDVFGIAYVATMLTAFFSAQLMIFLLLKTSPIMENKGENVWPWRQLISTLTQPHFLLFFVIYFLLQMSHAPYYTFFDSYLHGLGYNTRGIGLLIALGVVAEIILFFYVGHLLARVSLAKGLLVALLLTALRWFVLANFATHAGVLFFSQALHAASFGLTHAIAVKWLFSRFPAGNKSQGQAFYASVTWGLGGALGNTLAGLTWQEGAGASVTYLWAMGLCLFGACLVRLWQVSDAKHHRGM